MIEIHVQQDGSIWWATAKGLPGEVVKGTSRDDAINNLVETLHRAWDLPASADGYKIIN